MCTLVILRRPGHDWPLILAANRDEMLDRPWQLPPVAEANGPFTVAEGGTVPLSSAGSSDPDGDALTFDWDLDNNGTFETSGASPLFSAAGRNGPDTQTVVLRVRDGTFAVTDTATVNILNVPPTITSITIAPTSLDEGGSVGVNGTFSDPGSCLDNDYRVRR